MTLVRLTPPSVPLALAVALLTAAPACSDPPQEITTPVLTAGAGPAVPPLVYEVPGTWTRLSEAQQGSKRAAFKVPKAGADSEDAELTVFFFGTGSQGDPEKTFKEWLDQFDAGATTAKRSLDSSAGKVDVLDVAGTYKVALGPSFGPKKRSPMQMVKDKWRLHGSVVRTGDRGNWFFKLVGPDETVQASRAALETALAAAR